MTETTYDMSWFGERIGKSADWVRHHLADIPHRRIGRSVRFTEADLERYLRITAVDVTSMRTTGPRRRRAA